jgi:hypothetical protein
MMPFSAGHPTFSDDGSAMQEAHHTTPAPPAPIEGNRQ